MDSIVIKKYSIDNKTKPHTNKPFWEYYINDIPLSEQLDTFFQSKENILEIGLDRLALLAILGVITLK